MEQACSLYDLSNVFANEYYAEGLRHWISGTALPKLNIESRAVDFREVKYEVATEKEGTGCKECLGSAVYMVCMSCFPKGLFFFSFFFFGL